MKSMWIKRGIVAGTLALALLLAGAAEIWKWQEQGTSEMLEAPEMLETQATSEMPETQETDEGGIQACVAICVGQSGSDALAASGSGVIFEKSEDMLWIVTAGHVLEKVDAESPVYVDFPNVRDSVEGVTVQCTDYDVLTEADLAFLCLGREEIPEKVWHELGAVEKDKGSYDALQASDKVYISGYREGSLFICEGTLEEFWIYVEDFEQYMMLAKCELYPGMSGGGLYDEEGHLIGIVCGNNEQGEVAAVPLHVVEARMH